MEMPSTLEDIDSLINTQAQESLHLDYKDSRAIARDKRSEISKDVSAFANSDGGTIIYGVREQDHLPTAKDEGVDHQQYSREWLEQVINSNISPRIEGIKIVQIPLSEEKSIFVVAVPKSRRGPHQAADKRYYKRFNFQCEPMEDYEIQDVRQRQQTFPALISFKAEVEENFVHLVVENVGEVPAQDVTFTFPDAFIWRDGKELPKLLREGSKAIPPGSRYPFLYDSYPEIVKRGLFAVDVEISYFHPIMGSRLSESVHIDLRDYFGTVVENSELDQIQKAIKDSVQELRREIAKGNEYLESLSFISNATGLDLSLTTIQNLAHVVAQDGLFEKLDPCQLDYRAFQAVLGIDSSLAFRLQNFFQGTSPNGKLSDLNGMTEELVKKIGKYFSIHETQI